MSKYAGRLTPEMTVFTSIDHQTGLLSMVRDVNPDTLKNNILSLLRDVRCSQPAVSCYDQHTR